MALALLPRTFVLVAGVLSLTGCSRRKVPEGLRDDVAARRADAIKLADASATVCPSAKARAGVTGVVPADAPPVPPSPAIGSVFESDPKVVDVLVSCSWADPRDKKGATWAGTALAPLKKKVTGVPPRAVTMPEDFVENGCTGESPRSCEAVVVPSRRVAAESSADLVVRRRTPDGGEAEVTVVFAVP